MDDFTKQRHKATHIKCGRKKGAICVMDCTSDCNTRILHEDQENFEGKKAPMTALLDAAKEAVKQWTIPAPDVLPTAQEFNDHNAMVTAKLKLEQAIKEATE